MRQQSITDLKTTSEIKSLLGKANMDFDMVVNQALNAYLPKIFPTCPITDNICLQGNRCLECSYFKNKKITASEHLKHLKNRNRPNKG